MALGVMRRNAILLADKLAEPVQFGLNEFRNIGPVVRSADNLAQSRKHHLHQIVLLIASSPSRGR
jgi:hypothetical protein